MAIESSDIDYGGFYLEQLRQANPSKLEWLQRSLLLEHVLSAIEDAAEAMATRIGQQAQGAIEEQLRALAKVPAP